MFSGAKRINRFWHYAGQYFTLSFFKMLLEINQIFQWFESGKTKVVLESCFGIHLSFFAFLGPHPRHMEVPRLGVESQLQLLAYTTAAATWDLSHVCDLHHNSWQCWIPDPLSEARVEPKFSWILVGFISTAPKWELPVEYTTMQYNLKLSLLLYI